MTAFWDPAPLIAAAIAEGLDLGDCYHIEILPAPHEPPPRMPKDHHAVYVFTAPRQTLKVGLVGANNRRRYTRNHYRYDTHQNSSLPLSILHDVQWKPRLTPETVGPWIMQNCQRTNILIDGRRLTRMVALALEAWLIYHLNPRYEGRTLAHLFRAGMLRSVKHLGWQGYWAALTEMKPRPAGMPPARWGPWSAKSLAQGGLLPPTLAPAAKAPPPPPRTGPRTAGRPLTAMQLLRRRALIAEGLDVPAALRPPPSGPLGKEQSN